MITFATLWVLWILLTGSLQWDELLLGAVVAGLVSGLSARQRQHPDLILNRHTLPALLRYLGVFMVALLKANFDMARRVLSPTLPIAPAMVEVETALQSPLGKLMLANSITLTPGTLSVDLQQNRLLVHWIDNSSITAEMTSDGDQTALQQATREIATQFEQHLKGFVR